MLWDAFHYASEDEDGATSEASANGDASGGRPGLGDSSSDEEIAPEHDRFCDTNSECGVDIDDDEVNKMLRGDDLEPVDAMQDPAVQKFRKVRRQRRKRSNILRSRVEPRLEPLDA